MKLSIIIPAYNEERRLRPALEEYLKFFLPRYGDGVELLIVVNGSTDRTEQVAPATGALPPLEYASSSAAVPATASAAAPATTGTKTRRGSGTGWAA